MSIVNNLDTLEHYLGKVWITTPLQSKQEQEINVCVKQDGEYVALERLTLGEDGIYLRRGQPLGRLGDDTFRAYIEKLTGIGKMSEKELFDKVCAGYEGDGTIGAVARELGISKERVRRILITRKKIASELISNIAWLYDGGKGKSVADIAEILRVSENVVRKNMGYAEIV